jgi:sirohydrochlorin cobaltochelatase
MAAAMTGALVILPGGLAREARRQLAELTQAFAARLGQPVVSCQLAEAGEPVAVGIRTLVAAGAQRLVMVPLHLSPEQQYGPIPPAIGWANRRWPFLTFHAAAPITWLEWAGVLKQAVCDALTALGAPLASAAVVLVGAGGPDPLANANVARLAHLLAEAGDFARVHYAFCGAGKPGLTEALARLACADLHNVVVAPWLLAPGDTLDQLKAEAERAACASNLRAVLAVTATEHPAFLELMVAHHQAALEDDSLLAPSWDRILADLARNAGAGGHVPGQEMTPEEEAQLRDLDRRINEMLPPQYQGRYAEVSPTSMGSAPLKFGADGQVAWDDMWTSFCDLALAGGPCHRGNLLEAVPATEALAEPDKYQAVVAEIERGIKLVTGLPVVRSKTPGWVGVRCDDEAMALWLLRAIIVENVMVRREGDVLYLPAGPEFTLQRAIKNVVTVVAKTCHYWTAHRRQNVQGTRTVTREPTV